MTNPAQKAESVKMCTMYFKSKDMVLTVGRFFFSQGTKFSFGSPLTVATSPFPFKLFSAVAEQDTPFKLS